jgi:hypothetical protein
MNNLPAVIRNLPFDAKSVGSVTALVLFSIFCVAGAFSLFALVVLFCWNSFWSPVFGLHSTDFLGALAFTSSLFVFLTIIIALKEAK